MPGLNACKNLTIQIANSGKAENNYCGDAKLLGNLRSRYVSLTDMDKIKFRYFVRKLVLAKSDRLLIVKGINYAVGATTGLMAGYAVSGLVMPGIGLAGKVAFGMGVGFFAKKASEKIFDEKLTKQEVQNLHTVLPYLHIITQLPISMRNESEDNVMKSLYELVLETFKGEEPEQKPIDISQTTTSSQSGDGLRQRRPG